MSLSKAVGMYIYTMYQYYSISTFKKMIFFETGPQYIDALHSE